MIKFLQKTIVAGILSVFACTAASAASPADHQEFAEKMRALILSEDFQYARAAAAKYVEIEPDAAPVRLQLARVLMKTGYEITDDLIGIRYTDNHATQVAEQLSSAAKLTPDNAEAQSLLVHFHAVQGNSDTARVALDTALTLPQENPWLRYNAALLEIRDNNVEQAADYLSSIGVDRSIPNANDNERKQIYSAAWHLLRKLALQHPEVDPLPAVREGLITRVAVEDLIEHISKTDPKGKPIVVTVSSQDSGCGPCRTDLEALDKFARRSAEAGGLYQFIYASEEPWRDIGNHRKTTTLLGLSGVPHYNIINKGIHIYNWSGANPKSLERLIDEHDTLLTAGKPVLKVLPWQDYLLDDIYKEFVTFRKPKRDGKQAYAYAIDGKNFYTGTAIQHESQADADAEAMTACQVRAPKTAEIPCTIYGRGKKVVDERGIERNKTRKTELKVVKPKETKGSKRQNSAKSAKQKAQQTPKTRKKASGNASDSGTNTASARDAINTYNRLDEHFKALAIASGSEGSATGTASRAMTQKTANGIALEECEDARVEMGIRAECELHSIGKIVIEDHSEAAIAKITQRQQKRNIKNSVLKSSYSKYRKFSTDKAYAISFDDDGNWAYGIAFGKRGEDKARNAALEECEKNRESKQLAIPCTVFIVNNQFVD